MLSIGFIIIGEFGWDPGCETGEPGLYLSPVLILSFFSIIFTLSVTLPILATADEADEAGGSDTSIFKPFITVDKFTTPGPRIDLIFFLFENACALLVNQSTETWK